MLDGPEALTIRAMADDRLYLVASFLCGFSERFAKEVLGRILPESRQPSDPSND